ncbi:Stk1 family PASTA domain-containing Ser/Thr kinase [Alkalicoccus daliensis]|uniref:Serine/threonine-protein kinase PrkC n=1 Tax=Alkalicoccus daliensis TaxID=745820 RepID=A0A1H0A0V2_9BACI|nr:Stk1 family PASTA domain-containing Ser/Thr kinase [Alkalicoccus daliensis]SDN26346.1 serine/threonine protein kinase [Alkalicoccus daliensis]
MIGKRINERYKLIRPVGGGGMADVYLAKDLILDRYVAVKMLKSQFSQDDEFIRRFHREAEAASSLSHEHIVSIYDVGEEEDLYFIVMEYIEGQTLKEYIQENGPLSVNETIRILKQIASAVSHAHTNRIVHRDVKPQNILMSVDGVAKVADFGIARAISEATITHTNSILGSVHYLSPEQARGGQVTYKSDLYSVGVIVYEMLTGSVPFKGDTAVSVALKHLQEPLPSVKDVNPDIPQSVENMITKLTAKNPIHRFESAEDLLLDLQTVLETYRLNEAPLSFDEDADKTKAIPVIPKSLNQPEEDTIVHNQPAVPPEEKKQKKKWKKWAAAGMILAAGLILFVIFVLPQILRVDEVVIPEVEGLPSEEAVSELEELNLEVNLQFREEENIPPDHVITVRPGEGTSVKIGSSVTLIVNEENQEIAMEDVLGMNRDDAEEILNDFSSVSVVMEETTEEEEGIVLDQDPSPGDEIIPEETDVVLTVSERAVFTLGNLYGMSRQEVLNTVGNEPYVMLSFDEVYDDSMQEGRVIEQEPSRGTELTERTSVTVTFSRGPEPVEEPVENESDSAENNNAEGEENNNADSNENNNNAENEENSVNEESSEEPISAEVPFLVEVPEAEEEEGGPYQIRISVIDSDNATPSEIYEEEITETTEYQVPFTLGPDETGYLILQVNGEEFEDSPYEYSYEELQEYN